VQPHPLVRHSLRKTNAGISVIYRNGNYSNNLSGDNFTAEINGNGDIVVSADLSKCLYARNKSTNSYYDVNELAEDHLILEQVYVYDGQVSKKLKDFASRNNAKRVCLKLRIGDNLFEFPSQLSADTSTAKFIIIK